jgi:hypothetical protein
MVAPGEFASPGSAESMVAGRRLRRIMAPRLWLRELVTELPVSARS